MGIVSRAITEHQHEVLVVVALAAFACAEPEADPAFAYSTAGVLPYAYHALPYAHHALPYAPLVSYAGCTNNAGVLVPRAHGSLVAPAVVAAPAVAAASEEPVVAVEKREADPEADPWVYYSGVWGGHYGYGYHHYAPFSYSYAPYTYSHVYSHYGLPYAYYGKRSADAEPEPEAEAEADPYLLYSGAYGHYPYAYGYGYPYGYGYYYG